MTKEKQIVEMALIIHKIMPIGLEFSAAVATDLYNEGYQKQSEGEWKTVLQDGYIGPTEWVCSNCKEEFCIYDMPMAEFLQMMKHCPNCGAKMKGGE